MCLFSVCWAGLILVVGTVVKNEGLAETPAGSLTIIMAASWVLLIIYFGVVALVEEYD